MARILITSGPTRQYLDPVRYLTNASSGRMGSALAAAALAAGHEVVIVSGPVDVEYPPQTEVLFVVSTEEMLEACRRVFHDCHGLIAAAAPCDYRPVHVAPHKLRKTGGPLRLELTETPDIVATLAKSKGSRWMVAFALETEDNRMRALQKLERKKCDLIVLNGPASIHGPATEVEIIDPSGTVVAALSGPKAEVAKQIVAVIERLLIPRGRVTP
jgi:phosphopantothenoylcysteine decarboxylase/phosphopantothenate--cysteine ligase